MPKQETGVQPLGWEDPLEEGIATHSSILAWRVPCTEEPGGLESTGLQGVRRELLTKRQQMARVADCLLYTYLPSIYPVYEMLLHGF